MIISVTVEGFFIVYGIIVLPLNGFGKLSPNIKSSGRLFVDSVASIRSGLVENLYTSSEDIGL